MCHNTRLTDDDTGTDSDAFSLIVNNVDPITALASDATFADKAEEGETVTLSGAFTDVGTLDTYIASIDWLQVIGTADDDHVDVKVIRDEIDVFASFVGDHRRFDLVR